MHRLCAYRLSAREDEGSGRAGPRGSAIATVERWLAETTGWTSDADVAAGERPEEELVELGLVDGRTATLECRRARVDGCALDEYMLRESDGVTQRRTVFRVSSDGDETEVYAEVFAACEPDAQAAGRVVTNDVDCPPAVRRMIASGQWCVGGMPLLEGALRFVSAEDGVRLARIIEHPARQLPIILVSVVNGRAPSEGFVARLAHDVVGVASVAEVHERAAWALTDALGKHWSCFGGAVRLLWPRLPDDRPLRHPLWTTPRAGDGEQDRARAASALHARLVRQTMLAASTAFAESRLLADVRARVRQARLERFARANDDTWAALWRELARENAKLRHQLADRDGELAELRRELRSLAPDASRDTAGQEAA